MAISHWSNYKVVGVLSTCQPGMLWKGGITTSQFFVAAAIKATHKVAVHVVSFELIHQLVSWPTDCDPC